MPLSHFQASSQAELSLRFRAMHVQSRLLAANHSTDTSKSKRFSHATGAHKMTKRAQLTRGKAPTKRARYPSLPPTTAFQVRCSPREAAVPPPRPSWVWVRSMSVGAVSSVAHTAATVPDEKFAAIFGAPCCTASIWISHCPHTHASNRSTLSNLKTSVRMLDTYREQDGWLWNTACLQCPLGVSACQFILLARVGGRWNIYFRLWNLFHLFHLLP